MDELLLQFQRLVKRYLEGFKPTTEGFDNVEFGNLDAVKQQLMKIAPAF